ncbi:MAG: peptidoglycan-binding protein, partial [Verrucomicrobiota bacterium]|nr:peptidoglycan-binding protein [Verrucomicrobiota bacterium]
MINVSKSLVLLVAAVLSLCPRLARADESTRAVQEELRRRHLFYGNVDGRETPGLTAAIKQYQERKGFRQTGVADSEALRSMGITEEIPRTSALPDTPVLRSDRGLAPGEQKMSDTANESAAHSAPLALPSDLEARNYLREYLDACQGQNILAEMAFYAAQVSYFDRGVVTKTYIRNESVAYRQRWPERSYVLGDAIAIAPHGDKVQVTYRLNFKVGNS